MQPLQNKLLQNKLPVYFQIPKEYLINSGRFSLDEAALESDADLKSILVEKSHGKHYFSSNFYCYEACAIAFLIFFHFSNIFFQFLTAFMNRSGALRFLDDRKAVKLCPQFPLHSHSRIF